MAAKAPEPAPELARPKVAVLAPAKKPTKEVRIAPVDTKVRTPSPEPAAKEPEKEEEPADETDNESVADSEAERKALSYRALDVFTPPAKAAAAVKKLTVKEAAAKRQQMLQTIEGVRKKGGKQCTYFGPGMAQCKVCPPKPFSGGRCSKHAKAVSYAACKRDGCKGSTRSEVGLCNKCSNKARDKVNRDADEERRIQGIERIMALYLDDAEKHELVRFFTRSKKELVDLGIEDPDQ